jgi:ankyrin repeat protein
MSLLTCCKNNDSVGAMAALRNLKWGGRMNGMGRDDGNTALMYAISNNMYQVVFELLGTTICNRETALTWAFKKSKYDIAIKILQHTDANISNVPSKFLWYISDMIHKDRETLNETIEENKNLKDNLKMLSDMMHQDRETLHKTIEENKDLKNNL